jgi:hypothetical protein
VQAWGWCQEKEGRKCAVRDVSNHRHPQSRLIFQASGLCNTCLSQRKHLPLQQMSHEAAGYHQRTFSSSQFSGSFARRAAIRSAFNPLLMGCLCSLCSINDMRHADDHFGMDCEWERMNSSKASPAHFTFPPILLPLLRLLPWSGQSLLFAQEGSSSFRSWQAPLPCRRASKEAGTLLCAPVGE